MDDVKAWEAKHGRIAAGTFIALRTDWSKRWPDDTAMQNEDSQGIEPSPAGATRSCATCSILARSRHRATKRPIQNPGMDCSKGDYWIGCILGTNHYQIELLANLDQVPEFGALVVATFPKPKNGSGFPARVFAILP